MPTQAVAAPAGVGAALSDASAGSTASASDPGGDADGLFSLAGEDPRQFLRDCERQCANMLHLCRHEGLSVKRESVSSASEFATRSTVGLMLNHAVVDHVVLGGPAWGLLDKGDSILAIDGRDMHRFNQNNFEHLATALQGADIPGTEVTLTVRKKGWGEVKDVRLVRMATEMIADRRMLFQKFTALKDRAIIIDKDAVIRNLVDEVIALWSKMAHAEATRDIKLQHTLTTLEAALHSMHTNLPNLYDVVVPAKEHRELQRRVEELESALRKSCEQSCLQEVLAEEELQKLQHRARYLEAMASGAAALVTTRKDEQEHEVMRTKEELQTHIVSEELQRAYISGLENEREALCKHIHSTQANLREGHHALVRADALEHEKTQRSLERIRLLEIDNMALRAKGNENQICRDRIERVRRLGLSTRVLSRLARQRLFMSLGKWLDQARRARLVRKAAMKCTRRNLSAALITWQQQAKTALTVKLQVCPRGQNRAMYGAWAAWKGRCGSTRIDKVEHSNAVKRWLSVLNVSSARYRCRAVASAMRMWCEHLVEAKRLRFREGKFLARRQHLCLAKVVVSWLEHFAEQKRKRLSCLKILRRWDRICLAPALCKWMKYWKMEKQMHWSARNFFVRCQNVCLASLLRRWRQHCVGKKRMLRAAAAVAVRRREVSKRFLYWAFFRAQSSEDKIKVRRTIIRWTSLRATTAFDWWIAHAREKAWLRYIVQRTLGARRKRMRADALRAWMQYLRTSRRNGDISLRSAIDFEKRRRLDLARRCLLQMLRSNRRAAFASLVRCVDHSKRRRRALTSLLDRVRSLQMMKGFDAWLRVVNLSRKVIGRLQVSKSKALVIYFDAIGDYVHSCKQSHAQDEKRLLRMLKRRAASSFERFFYAARQLRAQREATARGYMWRQTGPETICFHSWVQYLDGQRKEAVEQGQRMIGKQLAHAQDRGDELSVLTDQLRSAIDLEKRRRLDLAQRCLLKILRGNRRAAFASLVRCVDHSKRRRRELTSLLDRVRSLQMMKGFDAWLRAVEHKRHDRQVEGAEEEIRQLQGNLFKREGEMDELVTERQALRQALTAALSLAEEELTGASARFKEAQLAHSLRTNALELRAQIATEVCAKAISIMQRRIDTEKLSLSFVLWKIKSESTRDRGNTVAAAEAALSTNSSFLTASEACDVSFSSRSSVSSDNFTGARTTRVRQNPISSSARTHALLQGFREAVEVPPLPARSELRLREMAQEDVRTIAGNMAKNVMVLEDPISISMTQKQNLDSEERERQVIDSLLFDRDRDPAIRQSAAPTARVPPSLTGAAMPNEEPRYAAGAVPVAAAAPNGRQQQQSDTAASTHWTNKFRFFETGKRIWPGQGTPTPKKALPHETAAETSAPRTAISISSPSPISLALMATPAEPTNARTRR